MNNEIADEDDEAGGADPSAALFGDEPGLPGFAPATAPVAQAPYRVLARKYRPSHFGDLIGQDAMVRTLTNAFSSNRIPQAWMLTGVRGVGKTTTARILARALNFQRADGTGEPTTNLTEMGINCQAIIEGRHIDVMEMDAASNTSVDAVRQINDAVRYAPVSARYKVYIIDEVHMLSGSAFNAFLKTLEEPPPHAKFIFATTEIRKVPVTILSRCQRFDLRRVDAGLLASHLAGICTKEGVGVDDEALALIARAAEGSVRDSLSLLDQAIAHGAGRLKPEDVRNMLGLADRARVVELFEMVMRGNLAGALDELKAQYDAGADPLTVMTELASFTHLVTRLKITPVAAKDPSLTEVEKTRGLELAQTLSIRTLSMMWQLLLRGLADIRDAQRPLPAAEMLMVRLCHASELPTPDEALRKLQDAPQETAVANPARGNSVGRQDSAPANGQANGPALSAPWATASQSSSPQSNAPQASASSHSQGSSAARAMLQQKPDFTPHAEAGAESAAKRDLTPDVVPVSAPHSAPMTAPHLASFADVVEMAGQMRDLQLKRSLEYDVRLVRFEEGRIEIVLEKSAPRHLANDLSQRLQQWTGRAWMISVVSGAHAGEASSTLREVEAAAKADNRAKALAHPSVKAALEMFRGATAVVEPRGLALPTQQSRSVSQNQPAAADASFAAETPLNDDGDDAGWPDETGLPDYADLDD